MSAEIHKGSALLARVFGILDILCAEYYRTTGNGKVRKGILARMRENLESLRSDAGFLTDLEKEINRDFVGILESVYDGLDRSLTSEQRRLVAFLYFRLSTETICELLQVTPSSLYNRKSRLLKRLGYSSSPRTRELIDKLS